MFTQKRKYTTSLMGGRIRRVRMDRRVRVGGAINSFDIVPNVSYSHGPVMYKQPEAVKTLPLLAGSGVASKPTHSVKPLPHPQKTHVRKVNVMDEIGKALSMM